jgi:release factor glutamine methyltransferase
MTFDQLLRQGARDGALSRLEARVLLAFASGKSPEWLAAHGPDPAGETSAARFGALVERRRRGEPIAYLTGAREFFGRRFEVSPAVLIPRPETELLVEIALERLSGAVAPRILDLGTGSGVLAVTLALERPDAVVVATDVSAPALEIARRNAAALGAVVAFREGHWWRALSAADAAFDLVVSNPPYVAASDPHLAQGDLRFEPQQALAAGEHGDDALRELVGDAPAWLAERGCLALEHGFDQGELCRRLMQERGLQDVATRADLGHRDRVTAGTRRAG